MSYVMLSPIGLARSGLWGKVIGVIEDTFYNRFLISIETATRHWHGYG